MCGFIFGATLEVLIQQLVYGQLEGVSVVWLVMTILSFALGLSTLMLLGYHSYLISRGMTTIEHMEITEEREDFKRRERIRRRENERELREAEVAATTTTAKVSDDAQSSTNLLNPITTRQPVPVAKFTYQSYSEGVYRNWCNALGSNLILWLIPVNFPTGNGIRFRKEEATVARNAVLGG